ncbi:ABC transporter related protein [Deinococcus proteolyticus MRP]|uniref:ABC transporter related protein n=2 Tax=Deinococcus TaxID=1298 RepID=F0RKQ0_DEIPM|nr:ATP-binding cassette domain-containing protein [Deinococcus proteolyticus]ADY26762.1 ABC transporter related protein [Deinococcus proteolyticus MRP]
MLQAFSVALTYGDQLIFDDISLTLNAGERLGLIGENGSGKTSLLRVLAGELAPTAGEVRRTGRVAYLTQQAGELTGTVLDAVKPAALQTAAQRYTQAMAALESGTPTAPEHRTELRPSGNGTPNASIPSYAPSKLTRSTRTTNGEEHAILMSSVLTEFAEAEESYRLCGGYDFAAQAESVLAALGLDAEAQAGALSGGQTRRLLLAALLLSPADLYLLDEPTNHLDAAGLAWLEEWIRASPAAFVLVSHDRAFLDAVSTHTALLERGGLTVYPAPYTAAMELRETERAAQERDFEAYRRRRAALEEERRRQASKSRSAAQFNHSRAGNVPLLPAKNKAQSVSQKLAGQARALERRVERLDAAATASPTPTTAA